MLKGLQGRGMRCAAVPGRGVAYGGAGVRPLHLIDEEQLSVGGVAFARAAELVAFERREGERAEEFLRGREARESALKVTQARAGAEAAAELRLGSARRCARVVRCGEASMDGMAWWT